MSLKKKISIYDTTLRDGAQTEGISLSLEDKIAIAKRLDSFGIDFIEGGWPYSNPKDTDFFAYFKKHKLKRSKVVPFGSTAHPAKIPSKDKNLLSLVKAGTEYVTIFGKSWDLHVEEVLRISLAKNVKLISKSVEFLKKKKKKVFYDAEHFFDSYKNNPKYAIKTIKAAQQAGADLIIFCDTNGGTLPWEIKTISQEVKEKLGLKSYGIHCHNDLGTAVANSLIVADQDCSQIQGSINGYGERCGNANLTTIVPILKTKMNKAISCSRKINDLQHLSYYVSEVCNMVHRDNYPFVGRSAFAHKGGVHIDAVIKNPLAYEHIEPKLVGNKRRFVVSELAGKSTLVTKAKELEVDLDKKSKKAKDIHKLVQRLEKEGYQFEAAEGSFKLLLQKKLKKIKKFFTLLGFKVIIEKREDNQLISEATIKLKIGKKLEHTAAEGDGPVNALDKALRKALVGSYPQLFQMHLTDFKVRVLDATEGTAAKVRVLIQSQDSQEKWTTIGVSENIIEASWQALVDSVEYKLLKSSR
ncbi:MAG: citramalate synthase [Candidatus Omnitrophica bacterium]|nr:citramalate synthase [Candidatus Omnitrophota bacterium]MCF7894082.1 citramalate synthase [Candidatus Omnitrophota bacterium]